MTQSGQPWLILAAGLIGLFVGLIAAIAFRQSEREQNQPIEAEEPELKDDIIRVLAVLRSAVIVLGHDDLVLRASPAAYAMGLVRSDELVHRTMRELVAKVRMTGDIVDEELELDKRTGDGEAVISVRIAHLTNQIIVIFAEDHTQARRIEQIRQDFAVNVSHELKTPVGAISLLAETLITAADDPEAVRRFAAKTQQEAQRLAALVHDIIELSRLQGASALLVLERVDIDEVVRESVEAVRVLAQARSQEIVLPPLSYQTVYGDAELLTTAVRNLLTNAIAYSPEHTTVNVGITDEDGMVGIQILDQGIGLDEEQRMRIFERFYRADPARARDTGGTGLGLSIVKHIAQDHGGHITVWSQPGAGSTFTLHIPRAAADDSDSTRESKEDE